MTPLRRPSSRKLLSSSRAEARHGLAPLEMVLSLPILMFVMALILIMGTAGAWKVRTQANSRQAAWRSLWPRTGANDPNPAGWPQNAAMQYYDANVPLTPADPLADFPVLRGPMLAEPSGQFLPVNTNILDTSFGMKHGHARIQRRYPLLAKLPPHGIDFPRETVVLDGTRWQYPTMGIGSNVTRRILFLYDFQLQARAPQLTDDYGMAALEIVNNPRKVELTPLEGGDPEILQLLGSVSPNFVRGFLINVNWRGTQIPQVSSNVPGYCTTNSGQVRTDKVEQYKRDVERRIPRAMSDYYISVYQRLKQQLEGQQQAQQNAQLPPIPGLQQQIDDLQKKIDQINQFKGSLPPLL